MTSWNQMSYAEQKLHINDMADVYIETAKKYDQALRWEHHPHLKAGGGL